MSELSFLIDLLLEHKLPKTAKDAVRARIKEVEAGSTMTHMVVPKSVSISPAAFANQAPSMQAIMARNPDLVASPPEPQPVTVVAQTPAAVAAMNSRQQAIAESMSGKVDKTTGRPRKF